jgi:GT2 family glycosyltransferase
MKLVVGFLTYNEVSAKYLPDFLNSLSSALSFLNPSDYQVLALDNSDQNNNHNRLAIEFFNRENGPLVEYLSAGENLGFSRAYNLLINRARLLKAEYFLVINPDTWLEPTALAELTQALDADQNLAAVSPKILRWDFMTNTKTKIIDSGGLILKPGLRFKDLEQGRKDLKQLRPTKIIGPSGAAGLFRLSALEKIAVSGQYFDERFFMYKEDCDLAYRFSLANLTSELVPTAIIYHDRTATSSGDGLWRALLNRRRKSRQIRSWSFLNQHLLFVKHFKTQNIVNKILIIFQVLSMFIFALILEQFLLKNYPSILKSRQA